MTPVALVRQALASARVPIRSVAAVSFEDAGQVVRGANAAAALRPTLRVISLLRWLPVVALLGAAVSLSQSLVAERQSQLVATQQYLSQRIVELEALSRGIEEQELRGAGRDAVSRLVEGAGVPYDGIRWLRARLPESLEVSQLEIASDKMRLSVRSPDVLADLDALTGDGNPWSAVLEGALTADPSTGLEMATIVCTGDDGAGE